MGTEDRGPSIADLQHAYEEDARLEGFRSACGFVTATWGLRCPRCGDPLRPIRLSSDGRVVSFTVQTVPSEEFLNDAPYAYVLVELEGGGQVTGWMPSVRSDADLEVGARVRVVGGYRGGVKFQKAGPPTAGAG